MKTFSGNWHIKVTMRAEAQHYMGFFNKLTHPTHLWTKWPPFAIRRFQMHFHELKKYFESIFTEVYSQGSNKQYFDIGSCYGLVSIRRQETWTDCGLVYWHIYVSPDYYELSTEISDTDIAFKLSISTSYKAMGCINQHITECTRRPS